MLGVHLFHVILQVVLSGKTFTTNLTFKHKVLIVNSHVTRQQELGAKLLSTNAAVEWLLCAVCVPVPQHVTFVGELFVTDIAGELGFLVLLHVHFKVGVFSKHFVALWAGECIFCLPSMQWTAGRSPHRMFTHFTILLYCPIY